MSRTILVLHKIPATTSVSLDLDLTQNGTFARSTEGSYYLAAPNSAGTFLNWAIANTRRIDTRGDLAAGLLMECSATNYLSQNRAYGTAPWTNQNGFVTVDQHAGPDGSGLSDRVSPNSANFSAVQQSPGPAGAVITSLWVRSFSGTSTHQINLFHNNAAASIGAVGTSTTTTWVRPSVGANATLNSGVVLADGRDLSPTGFNVPGGIPAAAEDNYLDLVQLEQGYYPTSVIRTTAGTVARGKDTLSYSTGNFPTSFLTTGFALFFAPDASSSELLSSNEEYRLIQNGTNDYVRIRKAVFFIAVELVCGGVSVASTSAITFSRAQCLTIVAEPSLGQLTVVGATSGNGTFTGTGAAWTSGQTLYIGGDNSGGSNVTGRFISGSIKHLDTFGAVASGEVLVSGTLSSTENGSIVSRKWQRGSDFAGGGSWSDIGGATSTTYSPVGADMGYDLRVLATDNLGRTTGSNTLRYDPGTATAVIDAFKIRDKSAGALGEITGSKTGKSMLQPTGGNKPTINATSFNGTPGLDFVGASTTFMSGNLNLSGKRDVTIVAGIKETLTISNGVPFYVGNHGSVDGSFFAVANTFNVSTPPFSFQVLGNGAGATFGGKYVDESALAATPTVTTFGFSTNNPVMVTMVRYNNNNQTLNNYDNQCVPSDFANDLMYWGQTRGGGLRWTGTLGGAFIILTGSTSTNHVWSAENYIKNAAGLSY